MDTCAAVSGGVMLPIWLDPTLFAAISALLLALVFLHRRTASAAAPTAEAGAVLRAPPWQSPKLSETECFEAASSPQTPRPAHQAHARTATQPRNSHYPRPPAQRNPVTPHSADSTQAAVKAAPRLLGYLVDNEPQSLYGLYKQATLGDAPAGGAGGGLKARAKAAAWRAQAGKEAAACRAEYVALLDGVTKRAAACVLPPSLRQKPRCADLRCRVRILGTGRVAVRGEAPSPARRAVLTPALPAR